MRSTITRECMRLHNIGVFDRLPDMNIVPQIETVAEAGARKIQVWMHQVKEALPAVVRSGFKKLARVGNVKIVHNSFAEIETADFETSSLNFRAAMTTHNGFEWEEPMSYSTTMMLATSDLKKPLHASFSSIAESTVWTFHHEAAPSLPRLGTVFCA